ncbi:unnamed protein product [Rotaria magnacalcarata]|uniref:Uncharacterized protein n=2 Tax=Rotaria magnacalcarata TaxID=392030 RepID=A0A815SQ21_9BILA|nr:unnamed protein product [Rotaria magnacalcarata]CAF2044058.1 unnamed protein product [Rotaria magnacalcarata]CAF2106270.1 unnamed protein product [Rotaria magnacalcarata]CAF2152391.1 unnamed protein product [Rotaria magnacalcarata]
MPKSLLSLIFNICFVLMFIARTVTTYDNTIIQLSVYPNHGFSPENIEVRCQITEPSIYNNIYLSVQTDNVKPSGIILMVDHTINRCRTNKKQYINVKICNSSLILVHINHIILNDTLQRIDYVCSQGEVDAISSYRILREQVARYSDLSNNKNLNNLSSTLEHTFFLLLFSLLTVSVMTIDELR